MSLLSLFLLSLSEFRHYKNQPANQYIDTNELVNDVAYALLGRGKTDTAIVFFKYNTTDYPDSANAFDSLAEAYMNTDQKQLAISHYQQSVALDPSNTHALAMIEKLSGM
jgi:tetratricopeptide (TPR) repeat protein